ncbi:hypothetical protein BHE74_00039913 [Ensete ventricosum]|uniref:Uncharacterized protein n=1 Tax=Ensete ventricosum TaxID=4639 RepID=A0A444CYW4_ENSVE|nr:hypothetical protein GW17_00046657 [Ensete ventricosum]RWW53595.1 hypothetical protein BHE74_00039913 [Ensete ventricosum]RZR71740.1 hypothetical protein BHM03_00006944 [Ensete ventricosum]
MQWADATEVGRFNPGGGRGGLTWASLQNLSGVIRSGGGGEGPDTGEEAVRGVAGVLLLVSGWAYAVGVAVRVRRFAAHEMRQAAFFPCLSDVCAVSRTQNHHMRVRVCRPTPNSVSCNHMRRFCRRVAWGRNRLVLYEYGFAANAITSHFSYKYELHEFC